MDWQGWIVPIVGFIIVLILCAMDESDDPGDNNV
jgi:hypothetical protein